MLTNPFLRAYMAGIVVPTMFLLVIMTVFALHPRITFEVSSRFVVLRPGSPSRAPSSSRWRWCRTWGLECCNLALRGLPGAACRSPPLERSCRCC